MSTNDSTDLTPNIQKLQLTDDFYTWFLATNKLIDYVNPIQLYDVSLGSAFTESRSNGVVSIDLNLGKGVKLFPSTGSGNLTLDLEEIYDSGETVQDGDYILIERPNTGDTNYIFSVQAEDMLPDTLNGNHFFSGAITVDSLNVNDNVIRLQYGDTTTQTDSGIILDTTSSQKVKFTYDTTKTAWISNRNIGVGAGYSYISNSTGKDAIFRFSTTGTQYDVSIELAMGLQSTSTDDSSWLIETSRLLRRLEFVYRNSFSTDLDRTIFYAQLDDDYGYGSTFIISDKIQIGNIAGSTTNFKSVTNYTANIIPISNSYGVLNSKWTNRYVTTNYSSVSVGDIVSIYDHTSGNALVTKESLSTSSTDESNAQSLGIVERISGGVAYIVMLGEFEFEATPATPLVTGLTYYLTNGSPNYSINRPESGIIKPLFIATGPNKGLLFPMSSGLLSYGKVSLSSTESGYIVGAGSSVYSKSTNGGITLVAGQGITLESDNSSTQVIIRALTQGNEPGYSTIIGDEGTILQAVTPNDTLNITGNGGGINVRTLDSTNADNIFLEGNYFRNVEITGDDTNQETVTLTAGMDDTLTLYGGVGIRLTNPSGNIIKFDATGDLAATITDNSLTLKQITKQPKNSVVVTKAGASALQDLTTLQATTRSMLMYTGFNSMTWMTPIGLFTNDITAGGGMPTGIVRPTASRFLGISIHQPGVTTPIGGQDGVSAFLYSDVYKPNSVNNVRTALIQGDGISLEVINDTTDPDWVGVPGIKVSNTDTTSKFRNVVITNTNETISADSGGYLYLTSPSGSPISLDGDSNSDTVYFDISDNAITNSHLALMADNTVKVGAGGTGNQQPSDLLIGEYGILGRLSGDLQSLDADDIRTILGLSGSEYFSTIQTDAGSFFATESETLALKGGSGISVSVGTDNNIIITNTLPASGFDAIGINVLGTRTLPDSTDTQFKTDIVTGVNKLYFEIGEFKYAFTQEGEHGIVKPLISWETLGHPDTGSSNDPISGPGLLIAAVDPSTPDKFTTYFSQVGNGKGGYSIPAFNNSTGYLEYINPYDLQIDGTGVYQTALLAFDVNGEPTLTKSYVRTINSTINGLQFSANYGGASVAWYMSENKTVPVEFNEVRTVRGVYRSPVSAIRLEPTQGKEFAFVTVNSATAFTKLMYLSFGNNMTGIDTSFAFDDAGPKIDIRTYSSDWYNLNTNKMCLSNIMIGDGPTTSTSTASTGYLLTNDSTKGSLVFTNYNFNTSGSKNIEKDRSSRLSLQVLNVDSEANNAYASVKTSGSIAHTYSVTTDVVDRFTMASNSYSSVKYLIQARSSGNKVFTSEFIVQTSTVGVGSCKYIQYASVSEDGGFTLDITAELSGNTVTIKHNGTAITANVNLVKVMKQEI